MVTSALPGDGKTFTSINLALSMARERDLSVLLVDADVHKADTSNLFGLRSERGLMDALADDSVDVESLVVRTNLSGLSLLPAGTPAENATELFSSMRMRSIASSLITSQPRRLVLLDAPPLLITSESRALIRVAGQVVLVVRAGKTPLHAVQEMVRFFDDRKMVGLVLNETQRGLMQGYDGYGYYGVDYNDSTQTP
jgi:protein-tyrosine kinase